MRRVVVESPFAAPTEAGIESNVRYARACVRDCLLQGDAPIASHLLHTQLGIVRDGVPRERALGIDAGHAWIPVAAAVVVYTDRGISRGMQTGIEVAHEWGIPVELRQLGGAWAEGEPEPEGAEYVVCIGVQGVYVLAHEKVTGPPAAQGWNGPGGRIEPGESLEAAAAREWAEEVRGLPLVPESEWAKVADTAEGDAVVHFMAATVPRLNDPDVSVDGISARFLNPSCEWARATAPAFKEAALLAVDTSTREALIRASGGV